MHCLVSIVETPTWDGFHRVCRAPIHHGISKASARLPSMPQIHSCFSSCRPKTKHGCKLGRQHLHFVSLTLPMAKTNILN